jgi:Uma2 family endonuclease
MTYEDFWALNSPDGPKVEWVDGEAIVHSAVLTRHARQSGFSFNLLSGFRRIFDLGEVLDDQLAMDVPARPSVRLPDILFVSHERAALLKREGLFGAADFLMEFVSEDSVTRDYREKYLEYQRTGVAEYVIVDSRDGKHRFEFHRLNASGSYERVEPDARGRYHSTALPGFWIDPNRLWQDPLPDVDAILVRIAGDAYVERILAIQRAIKQGRDLENDPDRS